MAADLRIRFHLPTGQMVEADAYFNGEPLQWVLERLVVADNVRQGEKKAERQMEALKELVSAARKLKDVL